MGCPLCTSRHPPESLRRACGSLAVLSHGGDVAGLLCSSGEGAGFWGPCTGAPRAHLSWGEPAAQVQEGTALPAGLAAVPVPRDGTPLRDGWGAAPSWLWVQLCPQWGVPRALFHRLCWWWGQHTWSRMLGKSQQTVTKSVPGRGRRGPCTPAVPSAWDVEGPGAGRGQCLSAC